MCVTGAEAGWKQDLTNEINIGVSDAGYSKVVLDCEDDHMAFVVTLEEEFEGVVYTRGSFHTRRGPCFLDAVGGKQFALKFGYKDCGTKYVSLCSSGSFGTTITSLAFTPSFLSLFPFFSFCVSFLPFLLISSVSQTDSQLVSYKLRRQLIVQSCAVIKGSSLLRSLLLL